VIDALSHVNWLAVLAASIAHFILGGLWFAGLMSRPYATALGIADRPRQTPGPLVLAGPFACSAIMIAATAVLMRALGIMSYADALALGALVGMGFLAPMTVTIAINPLFPRPLHYALVNAPFFLVGSLVSCMILVALA
jgi:hypothetical protein